jgi:hypothetical protein
VQPLSHKQINVTRPEHVLSPFQIITHSPILIVLVTFLDALASTSSMWLIFEPGILSTKPTTAQSKGMYHTQSNRHDLRCSGTLFITIVLKLFSTDMV